MKVTHKRAKSTKGWKKLAPKTPKERRTLLAHCGRKAFLMPSKLKFPIMAKSGACAVDCEGLRAAYARAKQGKHSTVAKRALAKARTAGCTWY